MVDSTEQTKNGSQMTARSCRRVARLCGHALRGALLQRLRWKAARPAPPPPPRNTCRSQHGHEASVGTKWGRHPRYYQGAPHGVRCYGVSHMRREPTFSIRGGAYTTTRCVHRCRPYSRKSHGQRSPVNSSWACHAHLRTCKSAARRLTTEPSPYIFVQCVGRVGLFLYSTHHRP